MAKKKTGRKQKHFNDPRTGLPVVGLSHMTDGRWRIIGTQIRFSKSDPVKAIERFNELTGKTTNKAKFLASNEIDAEQFLPMLVETDAFWRIAAAEIIKRPQWCAQKTGIEKLGYLHDLEPPEAVPTFDELETIWNTHYPKSDEQKRRVMNSWNDFKRTTKLADIRDITPELCISFKDNVRARKLQPKSESNMFTRIRRLFTFLRDDREVAPDSLAKIIDALKRLKASDDAVPFDPNPIAPEDFHALLKTADDQGRAMLHLMLNGAFSIAEVVRLKWSEVRDDGTIVTRRRKQGRCIRACVLWRETLDALAKLERKGDYVFRSREGNSLTKSGADKRFRRIRKYAKVSTAVTSNHLRDGALTAADKCEADSKLCAVLAGHRSGIKDHYVQRSPSMVAPVCEAIYAHYFGKKRAPKVA